MQTSSIRAKLILVIASLSFVPILASAQDMEKSFKINSLYFETRLGYQAETLESETLPANTGFRGQWLNFRLDGQICEGLTYSYRQRLNKASSRNYFDATDWIHLDWDVCDFLNLSAGKQVVAIGGYEYDRAPIDLYYCSEFWNNIPCYQMGVSATFSVSPEDKILVQLCNSPMRGFFIDENGNNKIGINVMWYGSHGFWETMWSANTFQNFNLTDSSTGTENWGWYLALGNRFNFTDRLRLDLDYMLRGSFDKDAYSNGVSAKEVMSDFSVMAELSATPVDHLRLFAKSTVDINKSNIFDNMVSCHSGELSLGSVSGGFEYYPLASHRDDIKIFGVAGYYFGQNMTGVIPPKYFQANVGIKFRLDVLGGFRSLINRI